MYVLLGMSLLFVAIGFILAENNAAQLLSGHNALAEEERETIKSNAFNLWKKFRKFL